MTFRSGSLLTSVPTDSAHGSAAGAFPMSASGLSSGPRTFRDRAGSQAAVACRAARRHVPRKIFPCRKFTLLMTGNIGRSRKFFHTVFGSLKHMVHTGRPGHSGCRRTRLGGPAPSAATQRGDLRELQPRYLCSNWVRTSQQQRQVAKQFRGHVERGTIRDHVGSWWLKGSVESPLLLGLHGCFRARPDCPRVSQERFPRVVKDEVSDPLSLRSPHWATGH